jgi:DNA-directed RNA polymerase subunit RPC12/RpoP
MEIVSCSKCGSSNIAKVKNKAEARAVMLGKTAFGLIHPTSYICKDCGYIEEYLEDKDLEKLRKKNI